MRRNALKIVALLLGSAVFGAIGWFVADRVAGDDGMDPVCETVESLLDVFDEWGDRRDAWNAIPGTERLAEDLSIWLLELIDLDDRMRQVELTAIELEGDYPLASIVLVSAREMADDMRDTIFEMSSTTRSIFTLPPGDISGPYITNAPQLFALRDRCLANE